MIRVSAQPIFESYLVVALIAGCLIAGLWITPNFASTSRTRARVLRGLRLATILCLVMTMLRPALVHTSVRLEPSTIAILLDASRSMSVPDVDERSRWDAMRRAFTQGLARREAAGSGHVDVQTYLFSEGARIASAAGKGWVLPDAPSGNQTDLGGALEGMLKAYAMRPLAAVVMLSDGAQRTLASTVPLAEPARELARRGVPLYTISFGRTREQSQTQDIAVEQLPDAFETFVRNEVLIRGTLRVQGYPGRDLSARMIVERPDGERDLVGPVAIKAQGDLDQVAVEFPYSPQAAGEYRLTVEAPPQPGEQVQDNNQLQAFLTVREGGLRILFLDGNLAWQEQKYIRRALDGAPEIDLDYVWIDPRRRSEWPVDLSGLFTRQKYDAVILSDVHARALKSRDGGEAGDGLLDLARRVNEGLGLMMLGGDHSFGAGGYGGTPLGDALQVRMSANDERNLDAPPDPALQLTGEVQVEMGPPHFVTRLSDTGENPWPQLPPLLGANRLIAGSTGIVLLKSPDQQPILVAGQSGLGRVLSFAGDTTFRWYRRGHEESHQRFWRQAILWLARKEATQDEAAWVRLRRRRIVHGGKLEFEAGFRSTKIPAEEIRLEATLLVPGGSQLPLVLSAPLQGAATGTTEPLSQAGEYRIRVRGFRGNEELGAAEAGFWVIRQDLELADSAANPEQLAFLSSLTEAAGGALIAPEQLGEILDQVTTKREASRAVVEKRWQLTDTSYDAWSMYLVMLGLLSVEWYWRRRWSMM